MTEIPHSLDLKYGYRPPQSAALAVSSLPNAIAGIALIQQAMRASVNEPVAKAVPGWSGEQGTDGKQRQPANSGLKRDQVNGHTPWSQPVPSGAGIVPLNRHHKSPLCIFVLPASSGTGCGMKKDGDEQHGYGKISRSKGGSSPLRRSCGRCNGI